MATLNEIAYNIKNLAYNGDTNEEENVGIRQIKFWIHYHRAKILKKLATEGKGVPQECLQKITFVAENYRQYNFDSAFYTWSISQNGWDNNSLVAYSKRTASLASSLAAHSINTAEFYGAFVGGGLEQVLVIRNLQSVFRQSNQQDDTAIPVFYGVNANLLLSNPTKFQDWANDDEVYPFPDYLVADLTREVMQEMQIALSTQPDMVTDGYDTTRTQVQQRAQR